MNPAFSDVRFRAELPKGGLPERFGIVTAWNPDGITQDRASNEAAHVGLAAALAVRGLRYFPVTGGSPDFSHAESGLGILADRNRVVELGREFRQLAVFWVERGVVHLCSCAASSSETVGAWRELATGAAAHPAFSFRGPLHLLDSPATAFLCSSKCPGDAILEAYDWARRQCDEEAAVISGFHTPVEQDVLAILARRNARIIWVPARDLPKKVPSALHSADSEGRLLILSPFDYGKPDRPNKESCSKRNQFILRMDTPRYIAHAAAGSSLETDLNLASQRIS